MAILDTYELKARLSPGLLAFLPVAFSGATVGLRQYPAVSIGGGLVTAAGGGYLLALLAAHFGRAAQDGLWQGWGGRPTTQLLRYADCATNATQRDIWRMALEAVTGVKLLSESEESANPSTAAETLEAASDQVRYLAQDPQFSVLASENAQYGFERNLFGFRWVGRLIAMICAVGLIVLTVAHPIDVSTSPLIVGILIDTAFAVGWMFIPSERRTKAAAFRYGNQLLQAVVRVAHSTTATTSTQGKTPGAT